MKQKLLFLITLCWWSITSFGQVVTTLAGSGTQGSIDATGIAASFRNPYGTAVDASGNVYVGDRNNNKIRKITSVGVVTTFAGSGTQGSTDGTGTGANFYAPCGVAVDASGNVYVADRNNNKIRKITSAGVVTTLAGSGTSGSADGTGTVASFNFPAGVAVDAAGNVYVADTANNKIRKITSAGAVTTFAGSGTAGGTDATGTTASFNGPGGIAVDVSGNVYVSEIFGNKIRKITSAGVVTTLAGSGAIGSADGTGTTATFRSPYGVAVDTSGNVYVADSNNNKIRKITSAGVVTTLAGGTQGSNDGTGTAAKFFGPYGIAVDTLGDLYVGDFNNHKIRKIAQALSTTTFNTNSNLKLYPNPSNGVLNISLENNLQLEKVNFYNHLGQLVKTATTPVITNSDLAKGSYFVEVITNEGKAVKQLVIN